MVLTAIPAQCSDAGDHAIAILRDFEMELDEVCADAGTRMLGRAHDIIRASLQSADAMVL
jgi:hypothetical protein